MNTFFNSCKRCMNPWMVCILMVIIIGLIFFIPLIGVATLLAVLPVFGCTLMCGMMALMMMQGGKKK